MFTRDAVIAEARSWLGTPWHHQASLKGVGCDCIGFIRGVALPFVGEVTIPLDYPETWTGASERTAKYWFAGTKGPTGEHLASLVRHSDAVLAIFLQLTGREASALAIKLADARIKLAEMLVSIDQLLNDRPTRRRDRDQRDRRHT
jgi:hypothetical protein